MTRYATNWFAAGACLSADPDLFYPLSTGVLGARQTAKARRICGHCRVRRECLEFAMNSREVHGIWGGTTPEERVRVRRQRAAARRRGRGASPASQPRPASRREEAGAA